MKLSVIIPIYKVEAYLEECLSSCRKQKTAETEFLLIDDGSPDNSAVIAKRYEAEDSRFHYFYKQNGGLSDARNFGVSKAKGDYIFFLDSDDLITDEALETIEEKLHQEPDCVVFDVLFFWDSSPQKKLVKGMSMEGSDNTEKMLLATPSACNKIFRKEIIQRHPFPVGKLYEDLATVPMMLPEAGKVIYVNEALYLYRQREGSIIYTFDKRVLDIFDDLEGVYAYYKENGLWDRYKNVLEYFSIEHLLLYANRRFYRSEKPQEYFVRSRAFIDAYFPDALRNPMYRKNFSLNDKLFVQLSYRKQYSLLKLLLNLKGALRKQS